MNDDRPSFAADCAVRLAADLIAHTWDPVVLMALRTGRRRRIELLGGIAGVSDKVLTQTLRRLLSNGLIVRIASPADCAVAYELSELGDSLPTDCWQPSPIGRSPTPTRSSPHNSARKFPRASN